MHEPSTEDYQSMCAVETLAEETQHCIKVPPLGKKFVTLQDGIICFVLEPEALTKFFVFKVK